MASDEELFGDGGDAAMTQLVGRYERPLYRFLLRLTGDAHLAEDLFQETFLRLHKARPQYRSSEPLKPYLYRIALNVAKDAQARLAARAKDVPLNGSAGLSAREEGDPVQDAESSGRVREAVAALPESERAVVVMRIFEGLSFHEIASITGVPVPTAKSRMLYALRRLRPVLEKLVRVDVGPSAGSPHPREESQP